MSKHENCSLTSASQDFENPTLSLEENDFSNPIHATCPDPLGLRPDEIVQDLDRFIIGQEKAKRRIALAHRDRERRLHIPGPLQESVMPKNILMVGPTGVGKTEIARRLADSIRSPFLKVEATKFTEVGYIGRDVEQIIKDLVENAMGLTKERLQEEIRPQINEKVEERILAALIGENASLETKAKFKEMLSKGKLEERKIDIKISETKNPVTFMDIPGSAGTQMGVMHLGEILEKTMGAKEKSLHVSVKEARDLLYSEEENLISQERLISEAIYQTEQRGIVFLDEIDKICDRSDRRGGGEVSREGVQRDLLPLLDGTTVTTKYGPVKTDHILFIASGAFHICKPCDLLPELQGRLPIRIDLSPLYQKDFYRILKETEYSLIKQYTALFATEGVVLSFEDEAIQEIARIAETANHQVENIGARRLYALVEYLLEDFSYNAPKMRGQKLVIDRAFAKETLEKSLVHQDLSRFIL
jgi:ATP-dependent HslUV protease ATP-binding subunit HslU